MKKILLLTGLVFSLIFTSCVSLQQDKMINSIFTEEVEELTEIEQQICNMDASYLLEKNNFTSKKHYSFNDYEALINQIDELLSDEALTKQTKAMLYSLKGRVLIFEQKVSKAKECYDLSNNFYKGDLQTLLLGSRLGLFENFETLSNSKEYKPYLLLESGLNLFIKKDYLGTVAKMDQAFISLNSNYKTIYSDVRNQAWTLREINQTDSGNKLLYKNAITIGDMLVLTNQYSNLLYNLTLGKTQKEEDLYTKSVKAKLFEPAAGKSSLNIQKDSPVTKIICARFLWNVFCDKNNLNKTRYSKDYENETPIEDISLNDPDFNAVIGCIEEEILDLENGIYFYPDAVISGSDFNSFIKKIK